LRTILSRTGVLLGVVTLALATVAGTAPAATGGSAATPHAPAITVTTLGIPPAVQRAADRLAAEQGTLTGRVSTRADVDTVITCTASSDYPHRSTTTPGAVDGKAKTVCDAPVAEIRAQGELYRYLDGYGFTVVGIGSLDVQFNSRGPVSSPAFDLCRGIPQSFYTKGYHSVRFPPGFQPPGGSVQTQSPVIEVTC
jgi:hypothetical protein